MNDSLFGGRIPDVPNVQKKQEVDLGKLLDEEIEMPKEPSVIMDNHGGSIPSSFSTPMFGEAGEVEEDYSNFIEYD